MDKIKFEPTINLGALIQLGGVLIAAFLIWGDAVRFQVDTENSFKEIARQSDRYFPLIDKMSVNDTQQDMQIKNLSDDITEIKSAQSNTMQAVNNLTTEITKISVGVARIEERMPARTGSISDTKRGDPFR